MTQDELFTALAKDAHDEIIAGHLNDAVVTLTTMASGANMYNCMSRVDTILDDYTRLLDFMQEGGQDPMRSQQQLRLQRLAMSVLQDIRFMHRTAVGNDIFVRTFKRLGGTSVDAPRPLASWQQMDHWKEATFDVLWTSPQLSSQECILIEQAIRDDNFVAAFAMSGLTLALLEYFDIEKLRLLLSQCHHADNHVRVKALLGVFTCTEVHADWMGLFPNEATLVKKTVEEHVEEATLLQHFICCKVETQRLYRQLHEEILPHIIRSTQGTNDSEPEKNRHITIDFSDQNLSQDLRQKIKSSFHDMGQLVRDGVIPSSGVFESLSHSPFFMHPDKWVRPFTSGVIESKYTDFVGQLNMCDCERYAFLVFLNSVNEEQARQVLEQLEQSRQKMVKMSDGKNTPVVQACYNTVECFARLLTQSSWTGQWPLAMSDRTNYAATPFLGDVLSANGHFLSRTIAVCYRYKRYDMALDLLRMMQRSQGSSASLLRRMAFCEASTGNPQAAIRHLRESLTLAPDHFETLDALQAALGKDGQLEAQRTVLMQMEQLRPEDEGVLGNLGNCLMALEEWKEAQKRFFHLEFTGHNAASAERAVAWCAVMTGDFVRARRYYDRLLSSPSDARWEDYLNCGHVAWLQGDTAEALSLYLSYARKYASAEPAAKDALAPFNHDAEALARLGISAPEQALMHDLIQKNI